MQQTRLPYINSSVDKKLRYKRLLSEPCHTVGTTQSKLLSANNLSMIEYIHRAKRKVQGKYKTKRFAQVVSLEDTVMANKNFQRRLKQMLYRSKNPELIAVAQSKKKAQLAQRPFEKQDFPDRVSTLQQLKRKVKFKSNNYSQRRTGSGTSFSENTQMDFTPIFQNKSHALRLPFY